jgi:hypothetical protein
MPRTATINKKALSKKRQPPPVPVETVRKKKWPSSPESNRAARCYVCMEVIGKHNMVRIGQNKAEQGTDMHIYRCDHDSCRPGGQNWKIHFLGKTDTCRYYLSSLTVADVQSMTPERQKLVGELLVKHKVDITQNKIVTNLNKRKKKGVRTNVREVRKETNDSAGVHSRSSGRRSGGRSESDNHKSGGSGTTSRKAGKRSTSAASRPVKKSGGRRMKIRRR